MLPLPGRGETRSSFFPQKVCPDARCRARATIQIIATQTCTNHSLAISNSCLWDQLSVDWNSTGLGSEKEERLFGVLCLLYLCVGWQQRHFFVMYKGSGNQAWMVYVVLSRTLALNSLLVWQPSSRVFVQPRIDERKTKDKLFLLPIPEKSELPNITSRGMFLQWQPGTLKLIKKYFRHVH